MVQGTPVVDYAMLASEDVDSIFDCMNYDEDLETLNTESDVIKFAMAKFDEIDWLVGVEAVLSEQSHEFQVEFLAKYDEALKECFKNEILLRWRNKDA